MPTIPKYLEESNVQDPSVRYLWDDWHDNPALEVVDKQLVARLKRISQRATLAFACGITEWIIFRFSRLFAEAEPWNFLEAAWAMVVHRRYSGYGVPNWQFYSQKNWERGPVKGPIRNALVYLEIAFEQLSSEYRTDPAMLTATLSTLANYVLTDPAPYQQWSAAVLDRLEALYPRNPNDKLGDVVPREALDPGHPFTLEETEVLVNRFLGSLNPPENRFLSPPQAIAEHVDGEPDFPGRPYRFSLETDRTARLAEELE